MSVRSTLALTALVTLTAPAGAQASPWATLALPQGVLASALDGQGKLVTYRDGTTLHVFSSVTRRWHATSVSATADVRLFNDCLLVVEPGYCRAFASHADAFVDVPRGPGASVLNDGSHKNDSIVLVADNGLLRAFSGFTGAWTTRALGANWAADVQRHVAVLADGGTLAGMSAFGGGWHDLPIAGTAAWLTADGSTALATEGAWVHGFSAHTSTWSSAPAIPSATFVRGDDWGLFYGSGRVLAYSGLRGSFAAIEHTVTGVAGASDLFALLSEPAGITAWSAVTADFGGLHRAPLQVTAGGAVALLHDAAGVRGYSALRQQIVPLPAVPASSDVGGVLAYVETQATGDVFVFDGRTAGWHAAPPGTAAAQPMLTATTLGLATATETWAFASAAGGFVPLGGPSNGLAGNPMSAPLLAWNGAVLAAFDDRLARWVTTPRTSAATPVFRGWRTAVIALDGATAHGYGAQAGAWHATPLPAGSASSYANSEVGYVVTADGVAACAMVSELSPFAQFPQFRRVQPIGAPLRYAIALPSGAFALAAFGAPVAPAPVVGLGLLGLDPGTIATVAVAGSTTALQWPVPPDPDLTGLRIGSQALVWPAASAPYLTSTAVVELW